MLQHDVIPMATGTGRDRKASARAASTGRRRDGAGTRVRGEEGGEAPGRRGAGTGATGRRLGRDGGHGPPPPPSAAYSFPSVMKVQWVKSQRWRDTGSLGCSDQQQRELLPRYPAVKSILFSHYRVQYLKQLIRLRGFNSLYSIMASYGLRQGDVFDKENVEEI